MEDGVGERKGGAEEMNSLVGVLLAVEEAHCQIQLLQKKFTEDTKS